MAISKSVLHIYFIIVIRRTGHLCLVSVLYFLSSLMSKSIAGHSEISLMTANQLWVLLILSQNSTAVRKKSYQFCWICINFVHPNLFLFNNPEWPPPFFFFTSDEEARYLVKLMLFLQIRPLHAFEKKYNNYRKQSGVQIHLVNGILWLKH